MTRKDTIVFDVGNVLIRWDPEFLYEKILPDAEQRRFFLTQVCPPPWNLAQDKGRPFADAIAEASARHPDYADAAAAWFDRWIEMVPGPVDGMPAVFDALKVAGYRMLGLTNFSAETWDTARAAQPVLNRFDGVLVSGTVGHIKPEPEIYRILFDRFDLDPARAVFIDDSPANIAAGRALGLDGIVFVGRDALIRDLAGFGIAVAG